MHISPEKLKTRILIIAGVVVALMYAKTDDLDRSLEYGGLLVVLLYISVIIYCIYIIYVLKKR